jgi:hypothetical protein
MFERGRETDLRGIIFVDAQSSNTLSRDQFFFLQDAIKRFVEVEVLVHCMVTNLIDITSNDRP